MAPRLSGGPEALASGRTAGGPKRTVRWWGPQNSAVVSTWKPLAERVSDSVEALLRQDHSEPSSRSLLHTPTRRHTQVWKDQLPPQSRALLCRTTASLPVRGRL